MLTNLDKSLYTLRILVAINFIVFGGLAVAALIAGTEVQQVYRDLALQFGGLSGAVITYTGEWWRVISTLFVHADPIHLLANMWSLYFLGDSVLTYYGGRKLLVAYVLAGIGGSLLSLVLLPPLTPTLGASGAVFGLTGLLLGGVLRQQRYGMELPFTIQDVFPLVMISLLYGFSPGSNVNNIAHIGGLAAGVVLGLSWNHYAGARIGVAERVTVNLLFYACIGVCTIALIAATVALFGLISVG